MFDMPLVELPIGPDPNEISKIAAAANSNQESFQPPPTDRWNFTNTMES